MLNRRDFAKLSVTAAAAITTTRTLHAATPTVIKPKRLSPGDTVGLVLPATAAFEADEIQFAKEQMEAIGFKVVIGKHAFDKWGYFAGHDRDRADDINQMFADDNVNGVVCYTGGWGSPRVLPYLDYDLIRRKPKVLIGYSDITALLNAVHKKTGLITFHGPVGASTYDPFTLDNFRKVVMTAEPAGLLPTPSKKPNELVDRTNRILKIAPGKATGPLIGGNLTMIATLMGTPYQPDTSGAIVFLEDVHEEPYRIDRMLTTLALGGLFDKCVGIVFGRCSDCGVKGPSLSLEEILRDRFGGLAVPVISGLSFGHIEQKLVLPIGARATLDADGGTVRVEEGAVT
ncbi:MAG TPA: LD-carboxypeptidase [Thermoanaerobaculia bacterium]|jgi:muramoyltetrapeptide carboxypeptidase|nr:LD-carboxypeptidase [Thermoanaerobaculia bacterium]